VGDDTVTNHGQLKTDGAEGGAPLEPSPLDILAGIVSGLIVSGIICGLLGVAYVAGTPAGPTPEPSPGGLMAFLVGMSALAGLIASVGGALRGTLGSLIGCVFAPLAIILGISAPALVAGQWPSFGWFFWWPCAIVIAVPFAIIVGTVAMAGAQSYHFARSKRRFLLLRATAAALIHLLTWALLTGMQWSKDNLPAPRAAIPAPSAHDRPERFPDKAGEMEVPPGGEEDEGKPR
jgi:hypothetical protein